MTLNIDISFRFFHSVTLLLGCFLLSHLPVSASKNNVTFLAFLASGEQLHDCTISRVSSVESIEKRIPDNVILGMTVRELPHGHYRVVYECGKRIFVDESVSIDSESRLIFLVDRSSGDSFKFAAEYPIGLRIDMDSGPRIKDFLDFSAWVRIAYVIDGEGWTSLFSKGDGVTHFPAKPGYYIITYPKDDASICSHMILITSWSSSLKVRNSGRCDVVPLNGVRKVGDSIEHVVPKQMSPE